MPLRRGALPSLLLAFALACEPAPHRGTEHREPGTDTAAPAAQAEHAPADHAHAAADDGGQALPLLPIMQSIGRDMTELTHGLMTDDTATVRQRAAALAAHAPIAPEELARIQRTLGPDMRAFEAVDDSVHRAAVQLSEAAAAGAPPREIVTRLGVVQQGCVSCHARFRERLRTGSVAR